MCWLISDAKSLPPGVYVCDKLSEEEAEADTVEIIYEKEEPNDVCEPITSAGACDANDLCTWCKN